MCATHSVLDPRVTPDWTCQELNGLCSSVISGVGAKYCAELLSSAIRDRSSRGAMLTVYTARRGRGGKWGNSEVKELEEMEMIWRWARTISPKKTKKCASMPRKFTSARNEDERRGSDGVMGDRLRGPTGARLGELSKGVGEWVRQCDQTGAREGPKVVGERNRSMVVPVLGRHKCLRARWRGSPGVTERDRVRGENFIASQGRVLVNLECRRGVWQTAMVRAHSLSRGRKWECRTRFGMVECKEKVVQNNTHGPRRCRSGALAEAALAAAAEVQQRRVLRSTLSKEDHTLVYVKGPGGRGEMLEKDLRVAHIFILVAGSAIFKRKIVLHGPKV
ncbi:hypothetical protein C8J57DRAFT_1246855 [Mycena rebaudengoi]|nr:hypothetical protein C8J57DRAFT_1246855 [Mycena rebaudengoi]